MAWYSTSTGFHLTTVTIDNGAYDIYTLYDALNTAFANQYDVSDNVAQYTVSFNEITGKISITPTFDSVPVDLDRFCIITNTHTGILEKLGYDLTTATTLIGKFTGFQDLYTTTNTTLSITATNLPDLYYPKMIYACIDQIRTPNRVALPINEYGIVLNDFAVTASFGELIHSQPYNSFKYHIPNLKTNTLTVRVIDQDGVAIDWNGGSWILVLGLEYGTQSTNEDPTMGRTFRPLLNRTIHDALTTSHERGIKRNRY